MGEVLSWIICVECSLYSALVGSCCINFADNCITSDFGSPMNRRCRKCRIPKEFPLPFPPFVLIFSGAFDVFLFKPLFSESWFWSVWEELTNHFVITVITHSWMCCYYYHHYLWLNCRPLIRRILFLPTVIDLINNRKDQSLWFLSLFRLNICPVSAIIEVGTLSIFKWWLNSNLIYVFLTFFSLMDGVWCSN